MYALCMCSTCIKYYCLSCKRNIVTMVIMKNINNLHLRSRTWCIIIYNQGNGVMILYTKPTIMQKKNTLLLATCEIHGENIHYI